MRRRRNDRRLGPRRALVVGTGPPALRAARELAGTSRARVVLSAATRGGALQASRRVGGAAAVVVGMDGLDGTPPHVMIVCEPGGAGGAALWAARHAPEAIVVLMALDGPFACAGALRRSGLPPWSILAPGGMPVAAAEAARLARRTGLDASRIAVPVIGGGAAGWQALRRYTTIGGIPLGEPCLGDRTDGYDTRAPHDIEEPALVSACVDLARAVLQDRREVLSCCAWVEGCFGISGAYVTVPVPIGTKGAEDPLPLRLTIEERALLQRAAAA